MLIPSRCPLAGASAVVALLALSPAAAPAQERPPTPVIIARLYEAPVDDVLRLVGTVHPRRTSVVASETEGVVRSRPREPGQAVEHGQPLVRLENEGLLAQLGEALADVRLRRFRSAQSARLLAQDALSEDLALEAEYELARAQARLQDLQARIDDLTVRAPFRGALVESLTEIGEWVGRGQGVARIVATDTVRVYVQVPERQLGSLRAGDAASVTVDALGSDSIAATVVAVLDQGHPEVRSFPVAVEFLNPSGQVRGGMSAQVTLRVAQDRPRLLVHKDAVVTGAAGSHVMIVVDGVASRRPVSLGLAYQGVVAVDGDGLAPGDAAIVRGNERVFEGQAVRVVRELP